MVSLRAKVDTQLKEDYTVKQVKNSETKIVLDGLEVCVVKKKRIRNINLNVKPNGDIIISAPYGCSLDFIKVFIREKKSWIKKTRERYQNSPLMRIENASEDELKEFRDVVAACTPVLVEKWEQILGVKVEKLVYRKMKSRWGSCQPATGRICINTLLALYPPECLEYVVVHELCHLLVPGHGQDFKSLMTRIMPDWKERRAKLV